MSNLFLLIAFIIVVSGCTSCKNVEVKKFSESYLTTAYKNEKKNGRFIKIGMSYQEVVDAWGEPQNSYKPRIINENNFYADEFWKYISIITPGKLDIWDEVYFQSGKVIKIKEIKVIKMKYFDYLGI
jgi:hypothetical protein